MSENKWMTEKPTNAKEWLLWAKAKGYGWADSAIEQMECPRRGDPAITLRDAIMGFSSWGSTDEGGDFWNDLHDEAGGIEWSAVAKAPPKYATQKPLTLKEWFLWAHDAGFTWADSGLGQAKMSRYNSTCHTMSEAIATFNSWAPTREGVEFWAKLKNSGIQWLPLNGIMIQPSTIIEWLEWAKSSGRAWADAAITNATLNNSLCENVGTLSAAINLIGNWSYTPEGEDFWRAIYANEQGVVWQPVSQIKRVKPKPRVVPIGCFTFDEFIDTAVVDFLDEFTDEWDQRVTERFLDMPTGKGFTDEIRCGCIERALNALNDAEFIAVQSKLYEHSTCIRRIRRAA